MKTYYENSGIQYDFTTSEIVIVKNIKWYQKWKPFI